MKRSQYRSVRVQTLAKASEVLGSSKAAKEWLVSPAMGLNGARPIDLLRTNDGARATMEFLTRLAHGVYH
jgi:putative toxin-antitoxin system antitoxin component (TIGR02293 family)